ncbi:hypothetical protein, conserved [Leishmania tarentolae]|uniref:Uncharacterized protein n=1 Tax=Leishmania tarentolae TaxID=5689 RepID=A0A640KVL3_LEITA|nr:hypothetical protein, conserved [Leishmania tarentolae]
MFPLSCRSPSFYMYPALPRRLDGCSGGSVAVSSCQRVTPAATPCASPSRVAAENGGYVITPMVAQAAPPPSQATKTSRSGRLFVNHNTQCSAQSGDSVAVPLRASFTATTGVLPLPSPGLHTGNRSQAIRPGARTGAHDGVTATAFTEVHVAPPPPLSSGPFRRAYATDRQGLVRGRTVSTVGETANDSGSPLSLEIEGVQTGEEVAVEVTTARVRNSTSSFSHDSHDAAQLQKLRRQLVKVTADLKASINTNRRQKQEHRQQLAEWLVLSNESDARLRNVQSNQASREQLLCSELSAAIKHLLAKLKAQALKGREADGAHAAEKAEWEAKHTALLRKLEDERAALATQLTSTNLADTKSEEADKLRAELEDLRRSAADQQRSLEEKLMQTQSTLQAKQSELNRYLQERDQNNYLVAQCRLFIQQVCQPGFSVVKGPSLEPVEKQRPEPTGFVLVPLSVLLYGYALLPEGDRQALIDHYDDKVKSLK